MASGYKAFKGIMRDINTRARDRETVIRKEEKVSHMKTTKTDKLLQFAEFVASHDTINAYDGIEVKAKFGRLGKQAFKELAEYLGLKEYDVRYNKGGIAVSGDLTLMGMYEPEKGIYISMNKDGFGPGVLYRTISGMKDFTGGSNNYFNESEFKTPETIKKRMRELLYTVGKGPDDDPDDKASPNMKGRVSKKPENQNTSVDLLKGDQWFKENPTKILGEEYETKNRFNRAVTKVKGTMENVIQGIGVPAIDTPGEQTQALETELKPSIEQLLNDNQNMQNAEMVIEETINQQADRELKKLHGEKSISLEAKLSFDEIMERYNEGLTADEVKAWVWYKRKTNGFNDEQVILSPLNGWSKYVVPLGQVEQYFKNWLKKGIISYYNGDFIPSVLYYAENIYERQVKLLAEKDELVDKFGQDQYDRQWNGLEKVKPQKLTLSDTIKENRLFIKPTSSFARQVRVGELADGTTFREYDYQSGKYKDGTTTIIEAFKEWLSKQPKDEFKKSSDWEIIRYYIENGTPSRQYDKEEKLRMRQNAKVEGDQFFVKFLAEGLRREDQLKIEQLWNKKYNGYVEIDYFKIPVGFTCSATFKNKPLFIRPTQREGIGFISVHGSGCIAYDVGVGKTMTAILSLAQALEFGQCKRPFIVVPNQTYKNWLGELRGTIEKGEVALTGVLPQYQVIDLYNLGTDYIDPLKNEEGHVQAVPEYSISVLTYEGFNRLAFNDETWREISSELFEILNQGIEEEREKAKLYEKIEEMMGKGIKGATVNIEELGFDYMVVDEAHAMKKSFTQVKGEQLGDDAKRERAAYEINSGQPSMTALRGFMVSQYILRNNKMRNVLLLTATPFTNSPLEIYSILALIGYQELEKSGIKNIKEFFDTYINTSMELVINAKLKPERKEVVMGFANLIALQSLIFKFITYKTGEDANIQRPNKIVLPLMNERSGEEVRELSPEEQVSTNLALNTTQRDYMQDVESYVTGKTSLMHLCSNDKGFSEEKEEATGELLDERNLSSDEEEGTRILRGLSFARQLALSPYLYACNPDKEPTYEQYIESSPKLQYVMECIRSVKHFHKARNEEISGQVIYMNSGVHYFPLIKEYLIKKIGYQEVEVGIIKGGMSASKKEGIKERFLAGKVKIIIGSATIKEGINLQNKATVLYNCWLDWNPTDVKQLEGRIWRFGNRYANVRIVNPLMENSIDTFIFQKLEEKTNRINEIWFRAGKTNALNLEEFNPSELKMGLVTDPYALAELLLMEDRELLRDEINSLRNQQKVLEEISTARNDFNDNIDHITKNVNRYRPQKEGAKARTQETIFKIYKDFLEDENTETTYKDANIYDTVRKANAILKRGLEQVLEPKGFDINFDLSQVVEKINKEIEEKEEILEERTGKEAVERKAKSIIQEREEKGYESKTAKERASEFASLNPKLLTELMIYPGEQKEKDADARRAKKGIVLEGSADKLEHIQKLRVTFRKMKDRLSRLQELKSKVAA